MNYSYPLSYIDYIISLGTVEYIDMVVKNRRAKINDWAKNTLRDDETIDILQAKEYNREADDDMMRRFQYVK